MSICDDCEFKGYSPELCKMHLRHIAEVNKKQKKKPLAKNKVLSKSKKTDDQVVKCALYGGTGVLGATLAVAAAPVLGVGTIAGVGAIKIAAGVLGATVGFFKSKQTIKLEGTNANSRH
ncbi:MAG: hypothetical protein HQK50_09770 [Oligoflexia bacterium]|nr:hypothetical protein [Oligoflexia bacterium]MBF0365850.1 hypothetical protein [Oligoflexia bacterium]